MYVYILHSKQLDKFYTGFTTSSIQDRLKKHNLSLYGKNRYTAKAKDWTLFLSINVECNIQGLAIEKHIKKMKSKIYIQNLIKYPEIIERLLSKYKCT